jgi:dinuclear metal center YbgI/SA1388 family protein
MPKVCDIVALLNAAYPFARAEKWDKTGLLIGDANATADRVLVAHEATDATIDEAQKVGANCLVVYHPPLFRALENLDFSHHSVRLASRCISANLAVVAVHTALDNAPFGRALGDKLASQLELQDVRVLDASGRETLCKLVVYVGDEDFLNVRNALWQAGAGAIGHYDQASFRSRGSGTFRPLEGANPTVGSIGELETVEEWRLEVLAPQSKVEACVGAMKAAHAYEEVALDIIKLENRGGESWGAARIGELVSSTRLPDFAQSVQRQLCAPNVRVVTSGKTEIKNVACVPGSGASYIDAAIQAGCDVLVTGDIKHHDALQAQAQGLAVVDATHTATERAAIEMIAQVLESSTRLSLEVVRSAIDTNPFEDL